MVKLDKLSVNELEKLQAQIEKRIPEARKEAIEDVRTYAKSRGVDLAEIRGPSGGTRQNRQKRQKRNVRRMRDQKTGIVYAGAGKYPQGFDMSRAVPA